MRKNVFWLTYDLGIDGDFDGLYAWLDEIGAKECGDSACYFEFDPGRVDPPKAILAAVRKHAKLRSRDRIYLIWLKDGKTTGRFIAGSRRRAPWAGYAV